MSEELVRVDRDGDVAVVTLRRAEARNALSRALCRELHGVFEELAGDEALRAVVFAGDGPSFCAGADLRERASLDADERGDHTAAIDAAAERIAGLPVPVVAAIRGHAVGGGAELALACDVRVAAEDAVLGFPEVRVGIFPGAGGVLRLPRLVGAGAARELLYTGRPAGAEEALRLGLVDRVVPESEVEDEAREIATRIAQAAPLAVRALKAALRDAELLPPAEAREAVRAHRRSLDGTADYAEGIAAFLERRPPRFTGE